MNASNCPAPSSPYGLVAVPCSKLSILAKMAVACLVFLHGQPANSQNTAATLPNVQISRGGLVEAIVVLPDGKLIIGGQFTSVNGVARQNIARVNADGSIDETWRLDTRGGGVRAIRKLILIGNELIVFGEEYLRKVSIVGDGSPDPLWNPPQRYYYTAALAGTNLFLSRYGLRSNDVDLVKVSLEGTGAFDTVWCPIVDSGVNAIAVSGTNLYLGGAFRTVNGVSRSALARISTTGAGDLDTNWNPNPVGQFWFNTGVSEIALDGTSLYVAGTQNNGFNMIGGQDRTNLARISTEGTGLADTNWNPKPVGQVGYLAIGNDSVYVAGYFTEIGGQSRTNLARLSKTDASSDPYWDPQPDNSVLAIQIDGATVYLGGTFTRLRGKPALGLAKVGSLTGLRDNGFPVQVGLPGSVNAIARQPDGKLIIGGGFDLVGEFGRRGLARLNRDGSVDSAWDPGIDRGFVWALAVSGADIVVGGEFFRIGGLERKYLAKISAAANGAVDPAWNPSPPSNSRGVSSLALSGTNLYVAFDHRDNPFPPIFFTNYVAKLSTTGSGQPDPSWNPTNVSVFGFAGGSIVSMVATETALFTAGDLAAWNQTGFVQYGIAKLVPALGGNADASWNPGAEARIGSLALSGTSLYLSGRGTIGSRSNSFVLKLDTEGAGDADPSWQPPLANFFPFNNVPRLLGISGTNLLAYGIFTNAGGEFLTNMVRLDIGGTGQRDLNWNFPNESARSIIGDYPYWATFLPVERDFCLGLNGLALFPVADAPSMVKLSATNLVILRNSQDGYEITHFRITGITGGALYHSDGLTQISVGDFITVEQGQMGLIFQGAMNATVTAVSSLNVTPDGAGTASATLDFSAPQPPVFSFSAAEYRVAENSNAVRLTIRKWGQGAASVSVVTADGIAVAYNSDGDTGDYEPRDTPVQVNFPSWPTNKSFLVFINDDLEFEGDELFWVMLTNATGGGRLAYPATAGVVILDDEPFGPTESFATNRAPDQAPGLESRGGLQVSLEPAIGQWRLAGELGWRSSGESISNLLATVYELEFKPLTNYYDLGNVQVAIRPGTNLPIHLVYRSKPESTTGRLTVTITPVDVARDSNITHRAQWRLLSEQSGIWHDSGDVVSNLAAGVFVVEFKNVTNFAAPFDHEVTIVEDSEIMLPVAYVALGGPGILTPRVLRFSEVTDTNWPHLYNGQLQTEIGFSSGVVVKERVVLTVAHGLFDDVALQWAPSARWFFQKHGADYYAPPQSARGWYVNSGYAIQRTNDNSPGVSTPDSQQLDAAALYFVENEYDENWPGRKGYGGYLASDAGPYNEYFLSASNKLLVGYPFDPQAPDNWGKMHATVPSSPAFRSLNPKVFATQGMRSFPGNSGGPLYVQWTNGQYYPAGIYLGGAAESRFRVIDSDVVDLINRAEASGESGRNHDGGGVIRIDRGPSSGHSWHVIVQLGPIDALRAGARWKGATKTNFSASNVAEGECSVGQITGATIDFSQVNGWNLPTYSTNIDIHCGETIVINARYDVVQPQLVLDYQTGLRLLGTTGTTYYIETNSDLLRPTWGTRTNVFLNRSPLDFPNLRPTNTGVRFYRARWSP